MYSMVQAGSMGVPFVGVRGLLGTDILKHRPDLRVIQDPFQAGEEVVAAKALRPDVAVFHALKADQFGNAITPGLRDDLMLARASRLVVVTAESISEKELVRRDGGDDTFLPAIDVDMVVHVPFGAHPCSCGHLYEVDQAHLKEYLEAAQEEKTFRAYVDRTSRVTGSHEEYLKRTALPPAMGGRE